MNRASVNAATYATRTVTFDADLSLGSVTLVSADANGKETRETLEALGVVEVPAGAAVSLRVRPKTEGLPYLVLRALAPDALEVLNLWDCLIDDNVLVDCVSHMTGLRALDLCGTDTTDVGVTVVEDFGSLEWLSLTETLVTDRGVRSLARLGKLKRLSLKDTDVGDASASTLVSLSGLEWLSMLRTGLSDDGLLALAAAPSLKALSVNGTAVTERGLEQWALRRPDVELFDHGSILRPTRPARGHDRS